MCSSGSKNPRFFGGPRASPRGVVIRISLMRNSTDLKNVRGIKHHNPLSAYGRKESRPRTERPSERRAFCTIREREAKLSGRARTLHHLRRPDLVPDAS